MSIPKYICEYVPEYIPYDIQLIIYRYLHELYMIDIVKEIENIKNDISILNYLREKVLYPYIFWNRINKMINNKYYMTVIDRYIHRKRMVKSLRCLRCLKK